MTALVVPVPGSVRERWHLVERVLTHGIENPGIGGSEYFSILLSRLMANEFENLIFFDTGEGIFFDPSGSTVSVVFDDSQLTWFVNAMLSPDKIPIRPGDRVFVFSHHPFDSSLSSWRAKYPSCIQISLGTFQFQSNGGKRKGHFQIRSFFPKVDLDLPREQSGVVGHVSSLHPSKGFHRVLRVFFELKKIRPSVKLEVLGGPNLYSANGLSVNDSTPYFDDIRKYISTHGLQDSVSFLGVEANVAERIRGWDAVIQNPSGLGEADPMILKEAWAVGRPVFAASDFGFREYLGGRTSPFTIKTSARRAARKIDEVIAEPELFQSLVLDQVKNFELSNRLSMVKIKLLLTENSADINSLSDYWRTGRTFSLLIRIRRGWWRLYNLAQEIR